jgi:hypothetical protein
VESVDGRRAWLLPIQDMQVSLCALVNEPCCTWAYNFVHALPGNLKLTNGGRGIAYAGIPVPTDDFPLVAWNGVQDGFHLASCRIFINPTSVQVGQGRKIHVADP